MDEQDPSRRSRRPVTSGATALALVLGAVAVWWLFSGNGPQGPSGNATRYAVPDSDVSATAAGAASTGPVPVSPDGVRIDSYVVEDPLRLAVNYRLALRCSGALESPRVFETDAAVSITLTSAPGESAPRCDDALERHTVVVLLDSPLDGRSILDGSTAPQVRVERAGESYE